MSSTSPPYYRLLLACVATVGLFALVVTPVDAQSREDLAAGKVFISSTEVPNSPYPRVKLLGVVDAPPDVVWEIVSSCRDSSRYMPNISKSFVVRQEGADTVCAETISLPFPLKDLQSVTRWKFQNSGDRYKRTWTLVEGDFDYATGMWTIVPFNDSGTRSLVRYEHHFAPHLKVPSWLSKHFMKKSLPDVMDHVRRGSDEKLRARGSSASR